MNVCVAKCEGEEREKPRVEREKYYTPPSVESDFVPLQVREGKLTSQWSDVRKKKEIKIA